MQSNCLRQCLRNSSPIFQSVRYASQKSSSVKLVSTQPKQKVRAKYAPSSIFGSFKPAKTETVKKPILPQKPTKPKEKETKETETKTEQVKEEEPKKLLTEDEKMV